MNIEKEKKELKNILENISNNIDEFASNNNNINVMAELRRQNEEPEGLTS
jgi:hypothetical protein